MKAKLLTVALVIFGGIVGKIGVDFLFESARAAPTVAQMETVVLQSSASSAYSAVREYFPDDADHWLEQMVLLEIKRREGTLKHGEAIDMGARVRQKHAHHLASSPDQYLREVLAFQVQLHEIYEDTPDACVRLLMEGPAALTSAEVERLFPILDGANGQFRAMYEGKENPVSRLPSNQADWEALYEAYLVSGHSEDQWELVLAPDPEDLATCEAFVGFFRTLRDADFVGAERIRADIVPGLIGS